MRQPNSRGFSLTELMVAAVVSSIVLLPFGIFMVQMVKASNETSEKLVLTSDAIAATLSVQTMLMQAKSASTRLGGIIQLPGVLGDRISFATATSLTDSSISTINNRLVIIDDSGTRVLADNVTDFSVKQIKDNEFEFTLRIVSATNRDVGVTITTQVLLLNVAVS